MDERDERQDSGREGFGDDGGARVGRPDAGSTDERSMARLAHNADDRGLEGGTLDESQGARSEMRADGSDMSRGTSGGRGTAGSGQTLDHAQRAQSGTPDRSTGAGAEAAEGVHDTKDARGANDADRSGSEPLEGRTKEHKPSYGGEGGSPRTSSDQRERHGESKQ